MPQTTSKPLSTILQSPSLYITIKDIDQQVDLLSIAMYTLAISQLFIQQLKEISSDIKQVWFADAPSTVAFYFRTTILMQP